MRSKQTLRKSLQLIWNSKNKKYNGSFKTSEIVQIIFSLSVGILRGKKNVWLVFKVFLLGHNNKKIFSSNNEHTSDNVNSLICKQAHFNSVALTTPLNNLYTTFEPVYVWLYFITGLKMNLYCKSINKVRLWFYSIKLFFSKYW